MTILTAFLVSFLAITAGTFLGNLALLWLVGRRAQAIERENLEKIQAIQRDAMNRYHEQMKKKQEYIKMES